MSDAARQAVEDPRTYFAAERTFLAWIRTGLGLMGVGFAVARFGLFLRQLEHTSGVSGAGRGTTGYSVYAGVGLVALGVLVNAVGVVAHLRTVGELRAGTWAPRVNAGAVALAVVLALVGVAMGTYLLVLR